MLGDTGCTDGFFFSPGDVCYPDTDGYGTRYATCCVLACAASACCEDGHDDDDCCGLPQDTSCAAWYSKRTGDV